MEDSTRKSGLISIDNLKTACQSALSAITLGAYSLSKFLSDEEDREANQDKKIQYMEQGWNVDLDNIYEKELEHQRNWEMYKAHKSKSIWQ